MAVTVRGRLLRTRLLGRPLLAQSLSLSLPLSDSSFPPSPFVSCFVLSSRMTSRFVVPLRFSLIISLPNFLPRYRSDALPFHYCRNHIYPSPALRGERVSINFTRQFVLSISINGTDKSIDPLFSKKVADKGKRNYSHERRSFSHEGIFT